MKRYNAARNAYLAIVATLALGASGIVLADDNSMSQWTGESYAYFHNLDNTPGKFNTARVEAGRDEAPVATMPRKSRTDKPVMLATRPSGTSRTNPFRDDTGA
jgi:hypothetical protein